MNLSAPRMLTLLLSLVLVALALASYRVHLPTIGRFVVEHRVEVLVAGYVVLAAGVLLRRL